MLMTGWIKTTVSGLEGIGGQEKREEWVTHGPWTGIVAAEEGSAERL